MNRRERGFTLIEVLLVAGILALLAAFALPQLFNTANDAKVELAKAGVASNGNIGRALDNYSFHMGTYPDTDEGLKALFEKPSGDDEAKWKGPYMNVKFEELLDPWGRPFNYRSPGEVNEDKYDLWSAGKDGQDDNGKEGSDDVKNWLDK